MIESTPTEGHDIGDHSKPQEVELDKAGFEDVALFHWSPRDRRDAIKEQGLRTKQASVDGLWRPPFTCWSDSPSLAWALSGAIHPEIPEGDRWLSWSSRVRKLEMIPFDDGQPREYRVYHNLAPSKFWYVATRKSDDGNEEG